MEIVPFQANPLNITWEILIIDDDEDDFFLAKSMLKEAKGRKVDVIWASTFQAGREALYANHYNAVLVDYDLGAHTGIELIREASEQEYTAPLILFTGRGSYEVDIEAMEAGATLYLTKGEANPLLLERAIRYAIELKQKEQTLREGEAQLRLSRENLAFQANILDSIYDPILAMDAELRITAWNKAAEKVYGYTAQEAIGQIVGKLLRSELSQEQRASYLGQLEVMGESSLEVVQYTKSDRRLVVEVKTIVRRDSTGMITGYVSAIRDITERIHSEEALRLSEEALRESEAMFRLALIAGQAGAWSWDLSSNVLHWSDEYYRIFGFEPGSVQPSPEAGFSHVHPDDLPVIEAMVRKAIADGTQLDLVHRVIWPDGSTHWVRGISRAFYNEQRQPNRMAGIAMDVTNQKHAEIELQAAHRQTIELMESISDAFYSLDLESRFTYINQKAARLWKKQPEDILGKNIWEVFPAGKETESYHKMQQAMADRKPIHYESFSAFLDEWVDVHLYPTDQGISVYFQDITERKRVEKDLRRYAEELERSNQALSDFAFIASHDLQEPIRKILTFSDSLRRHSGEILDQASKEYLDRMQNAADRMQAMIRGLLELSRVNSRGAEFAPIDLTRIVEDVVADLDLRLQASGGRVMVEELPTIDADELQMRQIFQNLIGNALKFCKPATAPMVRVTGSITGVDRTRMAEIRVMDNGIGFDQINAAWIFQPFTRLHGRSEYEGTGLGLAICQKIVERHHGKIDVQSLPGEGTTFILRFPVQPA